MTLKLFDRSEPWNPVEIVKPEIERCRAFSTGHGVLYKGDCLELLPYVHTDSIDTVFADPPFNLSKEYGARVKDDRPDQDYIQWSKAWLDQCIRVLKTGGALFVYNLSKWNIILGNYLTEAGLIFRHWIAVNIKLSLPIPGRLYPSHYSLLYFAKGKPKTFKRIRTPIELCRHCGGEIKDTGVL